MTTTPIDQRDGASMSASAAAAFWALMCATSAMPPSASATGDSGGPDSIAADAAACAERTEQLARQLAANVRYLPLMPLPRQPAPESAPGARRKRGSGPRRTNSERGREFRAKQLQRELTLLQRLTELQSEVHRLECVSRDLRSECALQTRHTDSGSLVKLVRLYHELFRVGSPEPRAGAKRTSTADELATLLRRQRDFLRHAVDPELQLGQQRGVGVLVELWKRYTRCHQNLRTCAQTIEVSGSEDQPVIVAHGTMQARYTRKTLQFLFPHVMHDEALVQRFVGLEVTYTYRNTYAFSADGRLAVYTPEVDFIEALIGAGASLADVSVLMGQALIADQYIVGPVNEDGHVPSSIVEIFDGEDGNQAATEDDVRAPSTTDCKWGGDAEPAVEPRSTKHRVSYLLD